MDLLTLLTQNWDAILDTANVLVALSSVIAVFYVFKGQSSQTLKREQHDKLFVPLFELLEPHLYKAPTQELFEMVKHTTEANKHLIDGKLRELIYLCSEDLSQGNFNALCTYVGNQYDKSCKRLGLKTRSIIYRINRRQFKNKGLLVWYCLCMALLMLLSTILFLALFAVALATIFMFYESSNQQNQLISYIFSILFCMLIFKLTEKYF